MERRDPINGENKSDKCSKPEGESGKSTIVYYLGAGLAMNGKRALLLDVDSKATSLRCWVSGIGIRSSTPRKPSIS